MGGAAAKERRRLERLALQGKQEKQRKTAESSQNEKKEWKGAGQKGRQKRGPPNNKGGKPKKPKHLKRKLMLCTNEEDAAKFKEEMEKYTAKKKRRVEKFEKGIREELGEDGMVNEEGFKALLAIGASKEHLLKVARGEVKFVPLSNDKPENDKMKIDNISNDAGVEKQKEDAASNPASTIDEAVRSEQPDFPRSKESSADSKPAAGTEKQKVDAASNPASTSDEAVQSEQLDFPRSKESSAVTKPAEADTNAKDEKLPSTDDTDEDSDVEFTIEEKRQRGKKRRTRQDEDAKLAEQNSKTKAEAEEQEKAKEAARMEKKTSKKERRCVGRKPVTDFSVGLRYDGKVVYVKTFGAFIDIGCHSDAFCHVSRISDTYAENVTDVVQSGDEVNVHVLEVDRRKKRLTVTLQSEEKINEFKASAGAKKNAKKEPANTKEDNSVIPAVIDNEDAVSASRTKPESEMTPAELKRIRKLARRAERRAQQETTGISA